MVFTPSTLRVEFREGSGFAISGDVPDGVWIVKGGGVTQGQHSTKQAAVNAAKRQAKGSSSETTVVVETKKGTVSERSTFGGSGRDSGLGPRSDIDFP